MQTSGIPARVAVPFADSGTKNTIPVPSQVAITPGLASYTTGFPPLTMTPITAGGVPPYGADFNGIFNAITNSIRWSNAGAGYPFDSSFSTSVSGYPKGSIIPASDGTGYWLNQTEANMVNPEAPNAALTGCVPINQYGVTSITVIASTSITLTSLQAAKSVIILTGAVSANINLIFPTWIYGWTILNNCTGAFTITCKTTSGSGVVVNSGASSSIKGDGVNITTNGLIASNNLSDLLSVSMARANLGLGTAAVANVGTGSNQLPSMASFTSGAGWVKFPDGTIFQSGTSISGPTKFPTAIALPISFSQAGFKITTSYDQANNVATDCPSFATTPIGLSGFYLMSSRTDSGPGAGANWIAIGK